MSSAQKLSDDLGTAIAKRWLSKNENKVNVKYLVNHHSPTLYAICKVHSFHTHCTSTLLREKE